MRVFLVRHGQAVAGPDDTTRPLTAAGRSDVRRVAEGLRSRAVRPAEIRHSGLRRAQETAEIIAAVLGLAGRIEVDGAFTPEADPQVAAARLADAPDPSLFVGHLPHLGRLVGLLVGRLEADPVTFHAGTVVGLERIEGAWSRLWVLDPPVAGRVL